MEEASIITITDLESGTSFRKLAPKRGNVAYARKMNERRRELDDLLRRLEFDYDVEVPGEHTRHKMCCQFLITFTYDQKVWPIAYAWRNVTKDLAKMRVQLKREIENYYGEKVHIRSITSKEGNEAGWPAPHMIVVFDRPLLCGRYKGKWKHPRYIPKNQKWKNQVFGFTDSKKVFHPGKIWSRGFCDIRAVTGNKVGNRSTASYAFKYLAKACKVEKGSEGGIAFKTMAWHKKYNLRAIHISSQFKEMLNPIRLDSSLHQSQQIVPRYWIFDSVEYCNLSDFWSIMSGCGPPKHGNSYLPLGIQRFHEETPIEC